MISKTLGNFEITNQLGKGEMGEVYQAKDRKLGRDVAIKFLPEEFARDVDRVARFQREAKLLASPISCQETSNSAVFLNAPLQSQLMAGNSSIAQTQGLTCVPWTNWKPNSCQELGVVSSGRFSRLMANG